MGTVLSISPVSNKVTILDDGGLSACEANGKIEKSLRKPSMIVSTLAFKRFVTASAKTISGKKVNPNLPVTGDIQALERLNNENLKRSTNTDLKTKNGPNGLKDHLDQEPLSPKPRQLVSVQKQPSSPSLISPRRVIVQASTGELLRCLGEFTCKRCFRLKELRPNEVIGWFRNVDRTLLLQGWQDQGFITPATLVFVYLLCRETLTDDIDNQRELQRTFLTCLYLAYSYIGSEISYPIKPFMVETDIDVFFERSLDVINKLSGKMLQINVDAQFFTEVFQDLKNEGDYKTDACEVER
ncbi:cyclin-dependent kinase 5 activator 2b [Paramisgurnus dabryanus]|uniref:cyclin-dependent kinase 5 activator 2b n=1 Tax=Paramisgurnus dabryanus TaxID=90735 RepID=UPI0031F4363C